MTFDELLDSAESDVKKWLLYVFQQAANKGKLNRLAQLIEAGQVERIIEELGLTQSGLAPVADAVESAFLRGANFQAALGGGVFDKWGSTIQRTLQARANDTTLRIYQELGRSLQTTIQHGLANNKTPYQIAQDILGLKQAGKRVGGALALTSLQKDYAANAELEILGLDRNYLSRSLRDRRYDGAYRKALTTGTVLPPAIRAKMISAYQDRLLKHRADVVARTETLGALNAGRYASAEQDAAALGLDASAVLATWRSHPDGRTRDSHRPMNGQTVVKGTPFVTGNGSRLLYPGDSSLGASASETINCRCTVTFKIKRA